MQRFEVAVLNFVANRYECIIIIIIIIAIILISFYMFIYQLDLSIVSYTYALQVLR